MNGVHDMGGMHGFGSIVREEGEPYFREKWEERVFGLFFGCFAGGHFNVDMLRHEIEKMPAQDYLRTSYYEHWFHAIESLLVKGGVLSSSEIDANCRRGSAPTAGAGSEQALDGRAAGRGKAPPTSALPVEMVDGLIRSGAPARLPDKIAPRFKTGDAVLARNLHPVNHTRLPRYVRGKRGVVARDHGVFIFNDAAAHGLGHKAQHVYSVRFASRELWGEQASLRDSVYIDLFDDYLDSDSSAIKKRGARP